MPTQRQQLENALEREDGYEDLVDISQSAGNRVGLTVVLDRHADHVNANDTHYGDLELLVCDDLGQQ